MNNALTTLAVSMHRNKGTFALLLGSGVSQSAQIPTGWHILEDLIRKVAIDRKEGVGNEPAAWYESTFKKSPTYSDLLELSGLTPAERSQTVKHYIEPNKEEREAGLKQPTEAHRAIASLVAGGYLRVIVTTNFDRLLEAALIEVGITPAVISSPDGILGSLPLAHNTCTIIKIHGDYLDVRTLNTASELSKYDEGMQRLLRQVFREYGLVISGWSAEWDIALVDLLKDERSPWFSTFWIAYSEPRTAAKEVIEARTASLITRMGADEFFTRLAESVQALADYENAELFSLQLAESSMKRYLDDPTKRIRIHELVVGEATRVAQSVFARDPDDLFAEITKDSIESRLSRYEKATETLRALFVAGCYWGREEHSRNWVDALERLANFGQIPGSYYEDWTKLRYYPALLLLYSGGVAALANRQYKTLSTLLYEPTNKDFSDRERSPLIMSAHCSILTPYAAGLLVPRASSSFLLPYRIEQGEWFWTTLKNYIPDHDRKVALFFQFEYLFGLVHTDIALQSNAFSAWGPRGTIRHPHDDHRVEEMRNEIERLGESWPPLRAGMFGSSQDRLARARALFDEQIGRYIFL